MSESIPRVSLGLPVYNGQPFLRETLDSILAQTYRDFELIICDNASTDDTAAICQEYAARDSRIRYERNAKNIGPAANYNLTFQRSRGELFKWTAADDTCLPELVEACVEALDRNPDAAMAYPRTLLINEASAVTGREEYVVPTGQSTPHERFAAMIGANHRRHGAFEGFGLYRREILAATPLLQSHCRGDSLLLVQCLLRGRFVRVERDLFLSRDHGGRSERVRPSRVHAGSFLAPKLGTGPTPPAEWWDPAKRGRVVFPEWRLAWQYFHAALTAPIGWKERLACFASWLWFDVKIAHKLARDLLLAAERPFVLLLRPASKSGTVAGHGKVHEATT